VTNDFDLILKFLKIIVVEERHDEHYNYHYKFNLPQYERVVSGKILFFYFFLLYFFID
jgi:hypothetical protein